LLAHFSFLSLFPQALYETKSIITGRAIPCATCGRGDKADGCWSRLPWTWNGVIFGSILFYIISVYIYQGAATFSGNASFVQFIGVATHTFQTRSVVWLTVFFVPITAEGLDVIWKTFANMYFPTQTQIFAEMQHLDDTRRRQNCCRLPLFQAAVTVENSANTDKR